MTNDESGNSALPFRRLSSFDIRHSSFVIPHCSARSEQPKFPRDFAVLLAGPPFIAHALVKKDNIVRIDLEFLVPARAKEFAVREGVGPGFAVDADVQRAGEGFLGRRRKWLPLPVEAIGQIRL